jgi:hypothetical protein
MSSPSRDGTMTDEVITNAEPTECRGPADGKDRSIRGLDSKQVQHLPHCDLGANPFEVDAWQIDPSRGEGTAQCSRTVVFPVCFDRRSLRALNNAVRIARNIKTPYSCSVSLTHQRSKTAGRIDQKCKVNKGGEP